MINIERTIEIFGYNPNNLLRFSNRSVVHNCDDCGIERYIRKADLSSGKPKFCPHCIHKGERNCNYRKNLVGPLNNNYKDGRTLFKHKCPYPGCDKQISFRSHFCKNHGNAGKKNPKHSKRMCGNNHPNWKGGISSLHLRIRATELSITWRNNIYVRDNYTCQKCGKVGVKMVAHHLKHFQKILEEFLLYYSQFSPVDDKETLVRLAQSWPEFWSIENGISLCKDCHKDVHSKVNI